jgi:hypothetical protein
MIEGERLEVLHLHADVLELSLAEKTGPIGPLIGAKNDPARFSLKRADWLRETVPSTFWMLGGVRDDSFR